MPSQPSTEEKKSPSKTQETTRLLLALWELGVDKKAFTKGELPDRAKRPATVFNQLVTEKAIKLKEINGEKQKSYLLEAKGVERLAEELKTVDFALSGATTGAWLARGLLKWLQQMETVTAISSTNGKATKDAIASYEAFKSEALTLFDELNKGFNYAGLVPIWHLRQKFSDRLKRTEFNDWTMQMQAEQLFYLQSGEAIGATEEQKQDSISSEIRGLLFYASQPD